MEYQRISGIDFYLGNRERAFEEGKVFGKAFRKVSRSKRAFIEFAKTWVD